MIVRSRIGARVPFLGLDARSPYGPITGPEPASCDVNREGTIRVALHGLRRRERLGVCRTRRHRDDGIRRDGDQRAGTWNRTVVSSNNQTAQVKMDSLNPGPTSADLEFDVVSWNGQISGTVSASSFSGRFKFSGTALEGTVCTGTATIAL